MNYTEFAATIKSKYPQYADRDDRALAEAMVKKFPAYAERVTFEDTAPKEEPKFYELEKQQGTPRGPMELVKQAGRQFLEGAVSPVPGSLISTPIRAVQETANQLGADVARATQDKLGTVGGRLAGLGASIAADPTNLMAGGMGAKLGAKVGQEAVEKAAPRALKIFAGVPEKATEVLTKTRDLFKRRTGSTEAIEGAVKNVQSTLDSVLKKEGEELGKVKKPLGLAKSADELRSEMLKGEGLGKLQQQLRRMSDDELLIEYQKMKEVGTPVNSMETLGKMSSLQQEMNSRIKNFKGVSSSAEGMLKATAKEIGQEIKNIPGGEALRSVQAKYARARQLYNELKTLMKDEGKAEQILENVFKSDSPRWKTMLRGLAELEKISGEPVLTNLFEEFSARALNKWVGRPGTTGVTTGVAFNVLGPAGAAVVAGLQSPKVMGRAVAGFPKLTGATGFSMGQVLNEASKTELNKVKQKLRARKDAK